MSAVASVIAIQTQAIAVQCHLNCLATYINLKGSWNYI